MSDYVSLTINGSKIKVPKGTSVLDAALEFGICIPHLCHMKDLTPIAACRLCIVEVVDKKGRSKVTASCALEAREGMVIKAHTEKILKARRMIAEMLVAEAPNSRAIQDIAARCGVSTVRFPFRHNNCVLCGKCIRVCGEVWQSKSLGFVGRGKDRHVALPFHLRPEFCKRCWSCIELCPMTIGPCNGPMKPGEEYLCNQCQSQLTMAAESPDMCMQCRLGEGFECIRTKP